MSNFLLPKVWLIPASDPLSTDNLARSMECEIAPEIRQEMIAQGLGFRYAWGAKLGKDDKNRNRFGKMTHGDLCLFYTADQRSPDEPVKAYRWMARIQGKIENRVLADKIWPPEPEEPTSFPLIYFLTEPIRIHLTPIELSPMLDRDAITYREGQRGFTTINAKNAEYVKERFDSIDGLMQFLLNYAREDPPEADYPELYQPVSLTKETVPIEQISFSDNLLAVLQPKTPGKTQKSIYHPARHSRQAKRTGDKAEELIFRLLKEGKIENVTANEVKHVAQQKFGWDIEYTNEAGKKVCVEVKGSSTPRFSNFELTTNELNNLRDGKILYHFYLVASCLSSHPKIQIIEDMAQRLENQSAQVTALTYRLELLA